MNGRAVAAAAAAVGYGVQGRHQVVALLMAFGVLNGGWYNANVMVHSWTTTSTSQIPRRAALQLRTTCALFGTQAAPFSIQGSRYREVLQPLRLSDTDATTTTTTTAATETVISPTTTSMAAATTIYTLDGVELKGPLTAVSNRIVVKVRDTLTATSGGILLPDQSQQRPTEGYVLVSGPGRLHPHSGVRIPNPIQPGMSVV
jgi:chaperonin GroES